MSRTFELSITCDGSAFADPEVEVIRILRRVIVQIKEGEDRAAIIDLNGNGCGGWSAEWIDDDDTDPANTINSESFYRETS